MAESRMPVPDHSAGAICPAPPGQRPARRLLAAGAVLAAGLWALVPLAMPGAGGLGAAAAGLAMLALAGAAARGMAVAYPHGRVGAANAVTLLRGALACLLVPVLLIPGGLAGNERLAWALAAAVTAGLALDGVDGWLARRAGLASPYGARFDMEVDAVLAALLSLVALVSGKAGFWVIALGFMRYAFVAATAAWPWLGAPLPPRAGRKTACVIQIAVLTAMMVPVVAPPVSTLAGGLATLALAVSFGVDLAWLWRRRN